jgi:hypothetical protein
MYMGYYLKEPLRAFCCSGSLATWCNAAETLAIKTDVANHSTMQSKTLNETKSKNTTNLKPIKEDSEVHSY